MSKTLRRKRAQKVPRSYRAGNLLALLESDLPGHTLESQTAASGHFVPKEAGPVDFEVCERVIKNFMSHITVAVFVHRLPAAVSGRGRVSLAVTGALRRTGLEPRVVDEGGDAQLIASGLRDDRRFLESAMALEFKRFELIGEDDAWIAEVELMGASQVVTAVPPMRRYIRLYPDQRTALLGAFGAIDRVLGRPAGH